MTEEKKTGVPTAEVLALASLAAYQEGAVVSRTIIDKGVGTVTAFAFAAGQGLSEHTAPFDALVYIYDGEAEITVAGTPRRVTAGDFIILPAGKAHALRGPGAFKMLLVMIRA